MSRLNVETFRTFFKDCLYYNVCRLRWPHLSLTHLLVAYWTLARHLRLCLCL